MAKIRTLSAAQLSSLVTALQGSSRHRDHTVHGMTLIRLHSDEKLPRLVIVKTSETHVPLGHTHGRAGLPRDLPFVKRKRIEELRGALRDLGVIEDLRRQVADLKWQLEAMKSHLEVGERLVPALPAEGLRPATHTPGYAAAIQAGAARRAQLFEEMLSSDDFAKAKAVSRETISKWRKEGRVLGLSNGSRVFRYPAWQAHDGVVLERLRPVMDALRGVEPWAAHLFLTRPHPLLGARTPVDLILSNDLGPVVKAAQNYAEEVA